MVRCRPTREEQTSQRGASLPVIVSGCSKALRHSSSWMAPSCFASGDVTAGALIVLMGMVTGDDDSSNTTCFRPGVGARRCVVRRLPVDPVNLPPDGGAGLGGGVGVIGGAGRCTVSTDGRVIGTDKSRKGSRCSAVCPHARQVELVQNPPQNESHVIGSENRGTDHVISFLPQGRSHHRVAVVLPLCVCVSTVKC